MRMFRRLLIVATIIITWPAAAASLPNRPVPSLDLHRYAGRWYEIARRPVHDDGVKPAEPQPHG
jgi:apolipoprotein D and lipocalin family protein